MRSRCSGVRTSLRILSRTLHIALVSRAPVRVTGVFNYLKPSGILNDAWSKPLEHSRGRTGGSVGVYGARGKFAIVSSFLSHSRTLLSPCFSSFSPDFPSTAHPPLISTGSVTEDTYFLKISIPDEGRTPFETA